MKNLNLSQNNKHAVITFDRDASSANILDNETLNELLEALIEIEENTAIEALLIRSEKPHIFIAGADIKSLASSTPGELAALIDLGHEVFKKLDNLKIPTVAVIHGACLGGGYELALACDWRIASDADCTKIGLPETQLGILPAWGGSTRLPRLIGLHKALPLILSGKVMSAKTAKLKGLIDAVAPKEHLMHVANELLNKGKKRGGSHSILHNTAAAHLIETHARKDIMKRTRGHYPALLKAMEVVCQSVHHDPEFGFRKERDAVIELASQPETARLIDLFFMREKAKKLKIEGVEAAKIKHPVVIGSGIMGSGIAYWLSSHGYPVMLQDINDDALAKGIASIERNYAKEVTRHIMSKADARNNFDRIHATTERIPLYNRDIIIEAAVENMAVKKQIFTDLVSRCSEDCILATNTSALPIHEIADVVTNPGRIIGLHFFNPVHSMPLVEIVCAPTTSDQTLATALSFVQGIGKLPVIVKDSPGFLVNRILVPYLLEACRIFATGIDPVSIDEAMLDFGMPMGPLRLLDEVGLDIAKHVAETLVNAFPDRMSLPPLMDEMIEAGYLGRKVGKGFYTYKGDTQEPNPAVLQLRNGRDLSDESIEEQLAYLMSEEAALCLDEEIAGSPDDIDFAMVMGTGYAPFRGGPLHHADATHMMRPDFYPHHHVK
jgi:3-hydroxyacyl-CoA dehydrogenase / enoyl-CoA hydratase / 3-hydroxybutyryl-CoA epimerase